MSNKMKIKREVKEEAEPTKAERKKAAKEKMGRGGKIVLVAIGCAAMLMSVSAMACSGILNQANHEQSYHLTGGVAATVKGTNITEDTVTKQVMSYRSSLEDDSDKAWAQFLVDQGQTPESYREDIIRGIAREYLVDVAVKEHKIKVTDEELDKAFEESAMSYGGREAFIGFLEKIGYTEESYKQTLAGTLGREKLRKEVAHVDAADDTAILAAFNEDLSTYNDARRSSNLLIKVEEGASEEDKAKAKEKAQAVLDKINAGEITFAQAVEENSDDTGSKKNGGDVGWDKLTTFVPEYQQALSALGKGEMSGLVETAYGYHIILCTDVFKLDGDAMSVDQIPEEFRESIETSLAQQAESAAYNAWLDNYVEEAGLEINPMPKDVPYNVSLEGVVPGGASDKDAKAEE